jgi:hypothetical protein
MTSATVQVSLGHRRGDDDDLYSCPNEVASGQESRGYTLRGAIRLLRICIKTPSAYNSRYVTDGQYFTGTSVAVLYGTENQQAVYPIRIYSSSALPLTVGNEVANEKIVFRVSGAFCSDQPRVG